MQIINVPNIQHSGQSGNGILSEIDGILDVFDFSRAYDPRGRPMFGNEDFTDAGKKGLAPDVLARLNDAVQKSGGVRNVARLSGIPVSTLSNALSGTNDLRSSAMVALARATQRSLDWLLLGVGDPATPAPAAIPAPDMQGLIWVPRYEVCASAGPGAPVYDEPRATHWPVPKEMLRGLSRDPKTLAWLDVAGDSMAPTLSDGDPVIIDQAADNVDREAIYVITVGGELFVKRVRRIIERDGRIALELISDNAAYSPIVVSPDAQESVVVVGRVVWPNTSRAR